MVWDNRLQCSQLLLLSAAEVNILDKHVPDTETPFVPRRYFTQSLMGILTHPSHDMDCSKSDERDVFEKRQPTGTLPILVTYRHPRQYIDMNAYISWTS